MNMNKNKNTSKHGAKVNVKAGPQFRFVLSLLLFLSPLLFSSPPLLPPLSFPGGNSGSRRGGGREEGQRRRGSFPPPIKPTNPIYTYTHSLTHSLTRIHPQIWGFELINGVRYYTSHLELRVRKGEQRLVVARLVYDYVGLGG